MKNTSINTVETDYRAEVVAAGLIEDGYLSEKTHIIRRDGGVREIKAVSKIQYLPSKYEDDDFQGIFTNRPGIYDVLPEGVFHQSIATKKRQGREAITNEIRQQRKEEIFARKFFQPFEMLLDKGLVDARIYEQRYNKPHLHDYLSRIFGEQWEILKHLSVVQSLLFLRLVPIIAEAPGSFELCEKVIGILLNCPVSVREYDRSRKSITVQRTMPLGTWKLGINSVLGKTISGDNPDLELGIGPINPEQMKLFEQDAKNNLILSQLIDMLFPFDRQVTVKYIITESEKKFRLSANGYKTYLGINTTL